MAKAMEALQKRTVAPVASAQVAPQAPTGDPTAELQRMASDDNTKATPQSNAGDIDLLAMNMMMVVELMKEIAARIVAIEDKVGMSKVQPTNTPSVPQAPVEVPVQNPQV